MNRFLYLLSIICFFSFTSLYADIVNNVQVEGNKRVSEETIKVYGDIQNLPREISRFDLDQIIKKLYQTNFFENIDAQIQNNVLIIKIKEYSVINQLVLIGEPSTRYKNEIKRLMKLKEKGSFIENNLKEDLNTIKKLYSSVGYNFAEIDPQLRKIDENNVDLVININRGEITRIKKINFTGDKKLKDKRLRDIISSQEDKFWKIISNNTKFSENIINLDKRLLLNYYKSVGYYDVKISSASAKILDKTDIEITYSIDAGKRYFIDKISTNVDPVFDKKIFLPLKEIYDDTTGRYHSPFKIKKILESIDEIIEKNNLQFVEHRVQETITDDKISLIFDIYEGKKISIERINILGNNITNESVIRGELLLDEGDPFTNLKIEKSIAEIKARNLFGKVDYVIKDGSSQDLKEIDILVEEKATGEISAGAGVGTDGGSFAISISENNWLGEGKNVGFNLELDQDSIKGEFTYLDPNYDLLGNSLNYRLFSTRNDKPDQGYENSLSGLSIGTSFEQYKNIFTNLTLNFSYDDLRTDNTASSSLKKQSGEFSEISGTYGFTLDQRDRAFKPTDGSIVSFNQTLPVYADKPFISNRFSSSSFHQFNENIVGAGKIFFETINGLNNEDVRISKRKTLSTSRLRGFEKGKVGPIDGSDHVGGNYAAAVNLEASLPNFLPDSSNAELGFFLDFGNVWGVDYDSSIDDSNKIRSSTGIALDYLSPLGPLSFIFATNLSKASTDETETFNFNLGTSF